MVLKLELTAVSVASISSLGTRPTVVQNWKMPWSGVVFRVRVTVRLKVSHLAHGCAKLEDAMVRGCIQG